MPSRPPAPLRLYRLASQLGAPLLRGLLRRRIAKGKEDPARIDERLGQSGTPRPAGKLIWLHAASVGESLSALPLIARIGKTRADVTLLVTTGTVTSAALMARRLPDGVIHHYAPIDALVYVRRFLDHWRPDLGLIVESEIWPNLIWEAGAAMPLLLINGRVSPRAYQSWRRAPKLIRALLSRFTLCLARGDDDAARLEALGAPRVRTLGDLKRAAAPLPADDTALAGLRAAIGGRPTWLAASTHPGEEEMVAVAHRALTANHPGLLTVIVPRHPVRGAEIAEMLKASGLDISRRAAGDLPTPQTDIYIADTMGELGLFYRLCPLAFIGGSLVPHGGQNPLEPARLGSAILHGPHMDNFDEIARGLARAGGAESVRDADGLTDALRRLMTDETARAAMAGQAARLAATESAVLDRLMGALDPFLDEIAPRRTLSDTQPARARA